MFTKLYALSSVACLAFGLYAGNWFVVAWNSLSLGMSIYFLYKNKKAGHESV